MSRGRVETTVFEGHITIVQKLVLEISQLDGNDLSVLGEELLEELSIGLVGLLVIGNLEVETLKMLHAFFGFLLSDNDVTIQNWLTIDVSDHLFSQLLCLHH